MTTDPETIAAYDARAREYADRFSSLKAGRHLASFMAAMTPGGRALDLGCGPGNSAAIMAQAGFTVRAEDASAEMVRLARTQGVDAHQATFSDLEAEAEYDGVWANFSLLHAPREDFDVHLAAIARALMPGGIFHIGMKTGENAARDGIGRQYTFYTIADLRGRLTRAGFDVIGEDTGMDEGLAGNVEPWVILLGRKHA